MGKDFRVIINEDSPRAAEFEKVFGTREVMVESPFPGLAVLPGFDAPQHVYLLDLNLISREHRQRLIDHLSEKFGMAQAFVKENLDELGVPILAQECTVIIDNPQRWLVT